MRRRRRRRREKKDCSLFIIHLQFSFAPSDSATPPPPQRPTTTLQNRSDTPKLCGDETISQCSHFNFTPRGKYCFEPLLFISGTWDVMPTPHSYCPTVSFGSVHPTSPTATPCPPPHLPRLRHTCGRSL